MRLFEVSGLMSPVRMSRVCFNQPRVFASLDRNGTVGATDLLVLLVNWGPWP